MSRKLREPVAGISQKVGQMVKYTTLALLALLCSCAPTPQLRFYAAGPPVVIEDTVANRQREMKRYSEAVDLDRMMAELVLNEVPEEKRQLALKAIKLLDFNGRISDTMVRWFTAQELGNLANFYSTPEGRSVTAKMPKVMADFTQQIKTEIEARTPK